MLRHSKSDDKAFFAFIADIKSFIINIKTVVGIRSDEV